MRVAKRCLSADSVEISGSRRRVPNCATCTVGNLKSGSIAPANPSILLVGERGFEPPAPTSRTWCSTRLSYSPARGAVIACRLRLGNAAMRIAMGVGRSERSKSYTSNPSSFIVTPAERSESRGPSCNEHRAAWTPDRAAPSHGLSGVTGKWGSKCLIRFTKASHIRNRVRPCRQCRVGVVRSIRRSCRAHGRGPSVTSHSAIPPRSAANS